MASRFELDLTNVINRYQGEMDDVVKKINFDLFSRVIMRTPVDTGRARGNWQAGINRMPQGLVDREDPKGGVNGNGTGRSTARAEVQRVTLSMKAGDTGVLVNHLPYIVELEQGSSRQAPAGMVIASVTDFPNVVERAVDDVKR
jgi:hypothetical protein